MTRRRGFGGALAALLIWLPTLASACPVCFSANNENVLETYYKTAAMMTALPLMMVAGIGGWLYVRSTRPRLVEGSPTPADGGGGEK